MKFDSANSILYKSSMIEKKVPEKWLEGLNLLGSSVPGLSNIIEPRDSISACVPTKSGFHQKWQ